MLSMLMQLLHRSLLTKASDAFSRGLLTLKCLQLLHQLHLFQVGDIVWAERCCLLKQFQGLLDEACSTAQTALGMPTLGLKDPCNRSKAPCSACNTAYPFDVL
jgi:hypothetical protein